ncbi:hypothetical protein KC571_01700, partial [candidate division WWE3 bacterium]|nr:hypothetical protein [candidate division WWE3 bacterium]
MRQKKTGEQKRISLSGMTSFIKNHKTKLILVAVVGLFIIGFTKTRANDSSDAEIIGSPVEIQKQVSLRAKNSDGDTLVQTFDVNLTAAQMQQRVLVRGTWIKAREGKRFLVINMDVTNNIK